MLTRSGDEVGSKAGQESNQQERDKISAEAAPQLLQDMQEAVRDLPKGARRTPPITVGDETITISETHAGVEIENPVSGECRIIPDMDFDGCVHVLAQQVNDHPPLVCEQTVSLADEIPAHPLLGLPPELHGAIARHLGSKDTTALACAGRSLNEDPSVKASVMEHVGPQLVKRKGLNGLNEALARIMALPVKYRLAPLQALAKTIPTLPPGAPMIAWNALTRASCTLGPRDESELFETLTVLAKDGASDGYSPAYAMVFQTRRSYQWAEEYEAKASEIATATLVLEEKCRSYPSHFPFHEELSAMYAERALAFGFAAACWLSTGEYGPAATAEGKNAAAWEKCAHQLGMLQLHEPPVLWQLQKRAEASKNAVFAYGDEARFWNLAGNDSSAAKAWTNQAEAYLRIGERAMMPEALRNAATAWENAAAAWFKAEQRERAATAWANAAEAHDAMGESDKGLSNRRTLAEVLEELAADVAGKDPVHIA